MGNQLSQENQDQDQLKRVYLEEEKIMLKNKAEHCKMVCIDPNVLVPDIKDAIRERLAKPNKAFYCVPECEILNDTTFEFIAKLKSPRTVSVQHRDIGLATRYSQIYDTEPGYNTYYVLHKLSMTLLLQCISEVMKERNNHYCIFPNHHKVLTIAVVFPCLV